MKKILFALLGGFLLLLSPFLSSATSGGGIFIDELFYSQQQNKIFYPHYYTGGGPGGRAFTAIDLDSKESEDVITERRYRSNYRDDLSWEEEIAYWDAVEAGVMGESVALKEVDLNKVNVDFEVRATLRGGNGKFISSLIDEDGEVVPPMYDDEWTEDRSIGLRVTPWVDGEERDSFVAYSCISGSGGEIAIRGYQVPGQDKLVVIASTLGMCVEYRYIVDDVFVIDGVKVPEDAVIDEVHSSFTENGFDYDIQPLETGFYTAVDTSEAFDVLAQMSEDFKYYESADLYFRYAGESGDEQKREMKSMKDRTVNPDGEGVSHDLNVEGYEFYEKGEYHLARGLFENSYKASLGDGHPNLGALYNLVVTEVQMGDEFHNAAVYHLRELFSYPYTVGMARYMVQNDPVFEEFSFALDEDWYSRDYNLYRLIKDAKHHFRDVSVENYYLYDIAGREGWIKGYEDHTLRPQGSVNRAEFAKMLVGGFRESLGDVSELDKFSDVDKEAWYAKYVARNIELGVVQGYGDGSFRPTATITKAEALKMVFAMAGQTVPVAEEVNEPWFMRYQKFADEEFKHHSGMKFLSVEEMGDELTRAEAIKLIIAVRPDEYWGTAYDQPVSMDGGKTYPIGFGHYRDGRLQEEFVFGAGIKEIGDGRFELVVIDMDGEKVVYRTSFKAENFEDCWDKNQKFIYRKLTEFDIQQYYEDELKNHQLSL